MELHKMHSITSKGRKRLGQGHGSGRMKTAGRGTKGQKARTKIPLWFEGGALSLIKRMSFHRGKGRNASIRPDPIIINVGELNKLTKNSTVDVKTLLESNIVNDPAASYRGIKILGEGELSVPLTVSLPVSKKAEEKIIQAGGSVEFATTVTTS